MPENSLAACKAAVEAGLGIECDIQRTLDGHPMVFHDWELDRLTQHSGRVEEYLRQQLGEVTLASNHEPIPSLNDLLSEVRGAAPLLIEIKSKPGYDVDQTCIGVAKELEGYSGDYAVMSFDPHVAQWFHAQAPNVPAGLVMREDAAGDTQTAREREAVFEKAQPDFLAYHIAALPNPWVAQLRDKGLPVLTWTVNSPETRNTALAEADALIAEKEGLA